MKVLIAPDSFKGSLTALQVAQAIDAGIKRVVPDATTALKPMADGGEGTVQALVDATGGKIITTEVTDPLGERVAARWGLLSDKATAVIEMAAASGLPLVPPEKRNPLVTTTYGSGELIRAALASGCRKLIIGIGGSATNDGGTGMAQALGVRFLDNKGDVLPFGGAALANLEHIDIANLDPGLAGFDVLIASDVNNPLCGPKGASAVYGPQKGASPEKVAQLDAALSHYADVIKKDLNVDVRDVPGAGAAGGLGMGLMVFLKARMSPGIEVVVQATGLVEEMKDTDLVLTAEGRIDFQSAMGKVLQGVAQKAKEFGIPVIALAGEVADDCQAVYQQGIDACFSIAPGPITLEQSLAEAEKLTTNTAENAMRLFMCQRKKLKGGDKDKMAKPKVFVARKMAQEALDKIASATEMELWEDELPPSHDVFMQKVKDIDGLLCLLTDKIDGEIMDAGPKLKVISNIAVGFDNIDVAAATKHGILVSNTPGVLTETTADFAFALLMATARRIAEGDRCTRRGNWKTWGPMILMGYDIHHATLGIVGCGRIGLEMARRARGFSMKVLYYDELRRKPEEEKEFGLEYVPSIKELLPKADFVSVHVPLTPTTRHLISTAEFAAMKPTAILINTSRGPVVDPKALYEALKSGQIFAAGLDVTEPEPIPVDDLLLTLDNIIIAPHIASASVATRTKMANMAAANLLAGLKGEMPPNCVNPEVFKKKG